MGLPSAQFRSGAGWPTRRGSPTTSVPSGPDGQQTPRRVPEPPGAPQMRQHGQHEHVAQGVRGGGQTDEDRSPGERTLGPMRKIHDSSPTPRVM